MATSQKFIHHFRECILHLFINNNQDQLFLPASTEILLLAKVSVLSFVHGTSVQVRLALNQG